MVKPIHRNILTSILLAVTSTALISCKSLDKPDSASFASVRIQGHTAEQIRAATVVVFQQDGYTAVDVQRAEMGFEKEGSRWDRIAYGSFVDDAAVWIRVRASVFPLSEGVFLLRCQAYKVRDKGDAVFEQQVRLRNNHSKPYQALLDRVLGQVNRYHPDLIVWLTTLESFPRVNQLASPIVANNPDILAGLAARYKIQFDPHDPALVYTSWWGRTIIGQRRLLRQRRHAAAVHDAVVDLHHVERRRQVDQVQEAGEPCHPPQGSHGAAQQAPCRDSCAHHPALRLGEVPDQDLRRVE